MQRQHSNQYTNIYFYVEKLWDQFFLFSCDRRKFNLTSGFFIFLFMVTGRGIFICSAVSVAFIGFGTHGKKYSRMDQVKFVEDSLQKSLPHLSYPLDFIYHLPLGYHALHLRQQARDNMSGRLSIETNRSEAFHIQCSNI